MKVLYISYDGVLDPLGQSVVVPYLEGLAELGHQVELVSYEKRARWQQLADRTELVARLDAAGIEWHPMRYHKRLSTVATAWDLLRGFLVSSLIARHPDLQLVHARSYPPALVAWALNRCWGLPYIFDMRGLYPEERVEGGIWPEGSRRYRTVKRIERRLLKDAAAVVTLTDTSVDLVRAMTPDAVPILVIPTSVDLDRFRFQDRRPMAEFTLAYFGSIGTWYLLDEILRFGNAVLTEISASRLLFLVNDGGVEDIRASVMRMGLPAARVDITSVPYSDVPIALAAASATICLVKPTKSKLASAPTKVSESLALGLPVAVNRGVGDCAHLVESEGLGVVVDPFRPDHFAGLALELAAMAESREVRQSCRAAAERHFSLRAAVRHYDAIYRSIARELPAADS